MEYWRQIPSFPMYSVSNYGRIRNDKTGRILRMYPNSRGYLTLTLSNYGEQHIVVVHRLVAEAFLGGPHPGLDVNHIDGDKTNNCIENLEWCTREENIRHAVLNGLRHAPRRKGVRIIETGEEFESIRECARYLDCDMWYIRNRLVEPHKTYMGYHFEYI